MSKKDVKKAGMAMATSFRHLSYLIVASSAFGYKSDESHFILGVEAFGILQVCALLLVIIWDRLDTDNDE